MKVRMIPLLGVAILALAFGAIATACDGDSNGNGGGEEQTLEEYFQDLEALIREFDDRGKEAEAAMEESFDISDPELDLIGATVDFLSDLTPIVKDFVDGLDALNPPSEAREAHDKAVEEGKKLLKDFEDTLEQVEGTDDPDKIERIISESSWAGSGEGDEFTDACKELQSLADENNISVDLDCEGGGDEF